MSSLLSAGHAGELGRASDRPGRPKLAIDHGLGGRDPVRPPAWAVAQLRPRPPRTSVLAAKLVWLERALRRFIVIAKGRECLDHVIMLGERQ
jgi:hypothetical protein